MSTQEKSFFGKLWERRVPQVFASYLIGSWAFIQFMDWIVNRYGLAPGWVEVCIIFLLLLLPSILMFTWYHGKPGKDEWRKIEKIFIPINLVIAGLVATVAFPTGSMAAETQTIQVTDEMGDTLTRVVPTMRAMQRFATFPFELEEGMEEEWLSHAAPILLNYKLEQDMRFTTVSSLSVIDDLKGYGYEDSKAAPANIYRTISEDSYCNYYLTGSIAKNGDLYTAKYQFHDTKTSKVKDSGEVTGSLYQIADQLHDAVRGSIFLKDFLTADDEYVDLPSKSLITSIPEAYELYVKGRYEVITNPASQLGLQYLQQSTQEDPDCAMCFKDLGRYGMASYGMSFKQQQLEKALPKSNSLPERQKFGIKYYYYFPTDLPKATALCEMWIKLYPMDVQPYRQLMQLYELTRQIDKALEIGDEAIAKGHGGSIYTKLASLASLAGKFEKSRDYLKAFAELYPKKAETVDEIGIGYMFDGQREKAVEFFENKILLDPTESNNYVSLGNVYMLAGEPEKQAETYKKGLEVARTPQDSVALLSFTEILLANIGQIERSFEVRETRREIQKRIQPPMGYAFDDVNPIIIGRYARVGKAEEARKGVDAFIEMFSNDQYDFTCVGNINYYIGISDGEKVDQALKDCKDFLMQSEGPQVIEMAQGMADLENGKYESAIQHFETYVQMSGVAKYQFAEQLGKAYRLAGNLEEAESILNDALQYSAIIPDHLVQLARIKQAQGKMSEAKEFAERAGEFWKDADDDFIPKKELESFIEELTR